MTKQQAKQSFEKGQQVTWTSQAAGSHLTKVGVIVAVVPAGKRPDALYEAFKKVEPNARGGSFGWSGRSEESYLVAVAPKTAKAKAVQVYWPRTAALQLVTVKPAKKAARKKKVVPSKKKAAKKK